MRTDIGAYGTLVLTTTVSPNPHALSSLPILGAVPAAPDPRKLTLKVIVAILLPATCAKGDRLSVNSDRSYIVIVGANDGSNARTSASAAASVSAVPSVPSSFTAITARFVSIVLHLLQYNNGRP